MLIIGHRPAYSQDIFGHRIVGHRVYALEAIDGITGNMPVEFFVSASVADKYGIIFCDALVGAEVDVNFDGFHRVRDIHFVN